jgi:hypothetical protein
MGKSLYAEVMSALIKTMERGAQHPVQRTVILGPGQHKLGLGASCHA